MHHRHSLVIASGVWPHVAANREAANVISHEITAHLARAGRFDLNGAFHYRGVPLIDAAVGSAFALSRIPDGLDPDDEAFYRKALQYVSLLTLREPQAQRIFGQLDVTPRYIPAWRSAPVTSLRPSARACCRMCHRRRGSTLLEIGADRASPYRYGSWSAKQRGGRSRRPNLRRDLRSGNVILLADAKSGALGKPPGGHRALRPSSADCGRGPPRGP